jgi:hypothetical protein
MESKNLSSDAKSVSGLDVLLERDVFLRTLLRKLSGILEDVVGVEDASGFISLVGRVVVRLEPTLESGALDGRECYGSKRFK